MFFFMNLYDVYKNNTSVAFNKINSDIELAQHIQVVLIAHKLLSPPADGRFGVLSIGALRQFGELVGVSGDILTPELAKLLIETKPGTLSSPSSDVVQSTSNTPASIIINYCIKQGYKLYTSPDKVNIIYLEGCNVDFTFNTDAPNYFNDLRLIIKFIDNEPTIVFKSTATTEPGRKYTIHPLNPNGAFRIAFGQHLNAWIVGTHKPGTSGAHEALVQVAPITGYRDKNKDYTRTSDLLVTGLFGINQHWGYDMSLVEGASAGCLTSQSRADHRRFMSVVKTDPDYIRNKNYRFSTIVLDASKVFA